MPLCRLACAALLALLFTACGSSPSRKVHPSTASIQQIVVQPDGSWRITLRIQNYSTFAMHYSDVEAQLRIAGSDAGQLKFAPDIDIVGSNSDVVETRFRPATAIRLVGEIDYTLKGTLTTSKPDKRFDFRMSSQLSPTPGLADTWR
ncbi:MAG: LEA type 2 family protein [Dokdonella sp.]|uniref:NDR1/HIN1-like protein n=1 Tax=Dokdonella sp. TaxID=2291710 RepID=UPI0025B9CAD7|nr:LEA type 2 family protein [Dokdonella sp.]MBX3701814.1 LEA type 2 family protein [Dokdonella sp.]MCW5577811.1 LEA type 2 family protein [Dokdonella sp.]